jgi:hypothetical protein
LQSGQSVEITEKALLSSSEPCSVEMVEE